MSAGSYYYAYPIIVPVQGLKRKQKLAVEMKAESQLTTVEVGCHSKSRRTAEISIQPTGQEICSSSEIEESDFMQVSMKVP